MKKWSAFTVAALVGVVALVAVACGGSEPEPEPVDLDVPLKFTFAVTEIASVGPVRVIRGTDRIPTGVDTINTAFYGFTKPVDQVSFDFARDGVSVFSQNVSIDPASKELRLPLSDQTLEVVASDIEPGRFSRRITVTSSDGETVELLSDELWVFDSGGSPELEARTRLADLVGVAPDLPHLTAYEPMDWGDASLGCPEPGVFYAQVITPGFRLVFQHEGQNYRYHTNLNASVVTLCDR